MNNIECTFDEDESLFIDRNDSEYSDKYAIGEESTSNCYITKFYDPHKFRYFLEYKLHDGIGKTIFVILMNPSYADRKHLDKTLYNVKTFLETKKDFNKFIVLNLFPIRTANSENLVKKMNEYPKQQETNDKIISEKLENAEDVILAWGNKYHYIAAKKDWFKKLEKVNKYAFGLNEYGTPTHFRVFKEDNNKSTLDDYRVNIGMMPIFTK